ncbi:MAG: hypothetical protein WCC48_14300 [Anaeromyxobacteraceae bacterium]
MACDLSLPSALLDYAITLPGDHLKLVLRLLRRARWVQPRTAESSRGSLRFVLSVDDLWHAMLLDRDALQDVAAFRHVLERLERGDWIGDKAKATSATADEEEGAT